MAHGLHYEILQSPQVTDDDKRVYRLKITVSRTTFVDDSAFRYRKEPLQPGQTTKVIMCDGVCSPLDMATYQEFDGAPSSDPEYFRLPYVDFIFLSLSDLEYARDLLVEELAMLTTLMDQLDDMESVMSSDIGDPLPESSSSVSGGV